MSILPAAVGSMPRLKLEAPRTRQVCAKLKSPSKRPFNFSALPPPKEETSRTVHLTKNNNYFFEQNRFSVCFIHTANSAHAKGRVPKHPRTISKSNSNFTSLRGALERLRSTAVASPPRQSGTTGLLLRPSSRACLHAAPGHLRRLHGDPPETQALERRCRARHEFR
jgi:hypothetical protein